MGTGMTTENWEALSTVTPFSDEGMLVATGAMDMVTVDPCAAVAGAVTAVSSSSMTPARLSTSPPKYWPDDGV